LPRVGERVEHKGVIFEVVEVMEYTVTGTDRWYLIAYRIIDRDYTSPVAHLPMRAREDFTEKVQAVIENYLQLKNRLIRPARRVRR